MTEAETLAPIEGQLAAYNAHDVDGYCRHFHDDVQLFRLGVATPVLDGMASFRDSYAKVFDAYPDQHCTVVNRLVRGPVVVDQEVITGRGLEPVRAVMIYRVEKGKIRTLWYVP